MLQDTPRAPQKTGNCALLARPKPASHRSTRCHRCHAFGCRRCSRPAAKKCAGSRPETRDVRGVNKCCSGCRRCGGHAWATPRTAAAPQVRGAGRRQRKRAGSARTCLIPCLEAPWRRARQRLEVCQPASCQATPRSGSRERRRAPRCRRRRSAAEIGRTCACCSRRPASALVC